MILLYFFVTGSSNPHSFLVSLETAWLRYTNFAHNWRKYLRRDLQRDLGMGLQGAIGWQSAEDNPSQIPSTKFHPPNSIPQ